MSAGPLLHVSKLKGAQGAQGWNAWDKDVFRFQAGECHSPDMDPGLPPTRAPPGCEASQIN